MLRETPICSAIRAYDQPSSCESAQACRARSASASRRRVHGQAPGAEVDLHGAASEDVPAEDPRDLHAEGPRDRSEIHRRRLESREDRPAGRETVDWVFTGDTGPNPALWQRLRGTEVRHIVIETAFGNDESAIAAISRHLSPATLGGELAQLDGNVAVHIPHIKPGEIAQVMTQVRGLGTAHQLHALHTGQVIDLG